EPTTRHSLFPYTTLFRSRVPIGGVMISLAGKAALITGGSRGIGAAAVKMFAQAGADVVFSYFKSKDAAVQIQQEARKHGTRVERSEEHTSELQSLRHLVC